MLGDKTSGEFLQSCHCLQTGWASVRWWEVVSECLSITCFFFFFFFPWLMKLSLSWPMHFSRFCPFSFLPHPTFRGVSEQLGGCLAAGQAQPTTHRKALRKKREGSGMHLTRLITLPWLSSSIPYVETTKSLLLGLGGKSHSSFSLSHLLVSAGRQYGSQKD